MNIEFLILYISLSAIILFIFIIFRSVWVCDQSLTLIDNDYGKYKKMKSYYYICFNDIFCFDIDKFIDKGEK